MTETKEFPAQRQEPPGLTDRGIGGPTTARSPTWAPVDWSAARR